MDVKSDRKAKKDKKEKRSKEDAAEVVAAAVSPALSGRPRTRSFDRALEEMKLPAAADDFEEEEITKPSKEKKSSKSSKKDKEVGSKRKAKEMSDADEESAAEEAPVAPKPAKRARKESVAEESPEAIAEAAAEAGLAKGNKPLSAFRLSKDTIAALTKRGVLQLFPIQAQTFDPLYDGKDLIGRARTGMGKTLAFVLPIIERLKLDKEAATKRGRKPRVIVMAPTRELAKQVSEDFMSVQGSMSTLCVYGGTSIQPQKGALWQGVDILVGTPGRIQDLMEGGSLKLDDVQFAVRRCARCWGDGLSWPPLRAKPR